MRSLIVESILNKQRANESEPKNEFKSKVEIGKTIQFNWWSMYGKGSGVKRIIKGITRDGKPLVKFNSYNNWLIEWAEIEDIY